MHQKREKTIGIEFNEKAIAFAANYNDDDGNSAIRPRNSLSSHAHTRKHKQHHRTISIMHPHNCISCTHTCTHLTSALPLWNTSIFFSLWINHFVTFSSTQSLWIHSIANCIDEPEAHAICFVFLHADSLEKCLCFRWNCIGCDCNRDHIVIYLAVVVIAPFVWLKRTVRGTCTMHVDASHEKKVRLHAHWYIPA